MPTNAKWQPKDILSTLDRCCEEFTFPALDNGYVYPAATRMSVYRSDEDWALVIEVFCFSPRSGIPDTQIYTIASRLRRLKTPADYISRDAYDKYISANGNNESTFVFPIEEGDWQDSVEPEFLAPGAHSVKLRSKIIRTPRMDAYRECAVPLRVPNRVLVFEFCRYLAATSRDNVLASANERRVCVPDELQQIMQIEEWSHPDIVGGVLASSSRSFCELSEV